MAVLYLLLSNLKPWRLERGAFALAPFPTCEFVNRQISPTVLAFSCGIRRAYRRAFAKARLALLLLILVVVHHPLHAEFVGK